MSSNKNECIPIYSFELILLHCQLTREFDVKTYILDLVKYKLCSLHSFDFLKDVANHYAKYKTL